MGTRATIKFTNGDEVYFVYRGHDGFPTNIIPDLEEAISKAKGRWSNPELGCLVALFLAMFYDYDKQRLPDYHPTSSFHGDESYRYFVDWNDAENCYKIGVE